MYTSAPVVPLVSLPKHFVRLANRLLVLVFLATAVASHADVARAQDEETLVEARAKFQNAIEHEQAGDYAVALQLFREVGQVKLTPQVQFHIALCQMNLGNLVAALGGYQLALEEAANVGEGFEEEVQRSINELQARIPKIVIERGSGADAAQIQLDGVELGQTSIGVEVPVDPGPHAVTAHAPGYQPYNETVETPEGSTERIVVELLPVPKPKATTTPEPTPPEAEKSADVSRNAVIYVVGGIGTAALIGSGVLFFLRQKSIGDLEIECPDRNCVAAKDPQKAEDLYNKLKLYNVTYQIALGVGAVGVGAALTLWLTTPKSNPADDSADAEDEEEQGDDSAVGPFRRLGVRAYAPGADAGFSLIGQF